MFYHVEGCMRLDLPIIPLQQLVYVFIINWKFH